MSKILNFVIVFCVFTGLIQCTKNPLLPTGELPRELTSLEKSVVESSGNFGLKLFKEINKEERDKNIFISPLSVSMALGMTYNGANGNTEEAMQGTLELDGLTNQEINESYKSLIELLINLDAKVKFQIANSIWYRQEWTVEDVFLNQCRKYFNAEVRGMDFNDPNAPNIINGWVDENTNGKIKEIVDSPIDPSTAMFLINALYFKGTWTYEFDVSKTKDDLFTLPDGSKKACKMMIQSNDDFQYFENADFQAIDLPYGDGGFRMTIFLPGMEKNINDFIAELSAENWDLWMNSFTKQVGTLELPRFKLKYEIKLNDVLKALGMGIAFGEQADFTGMYQNVRGPVYIEEVKHKTFVDVNEEGTEAAAVTSVEIVIKGGPSGFTMRVDRPFIFVIREHQSNTMLFTGKIVEPMLE